MFTKIFYEKIFRILNILYEFKFFRKILYPRVISKKRISYFFYFLVNRVLNVLDLILVKFYFLLNRKYRLPFKHDYIHNYENKIAFLKNLYVSLEFLGKGKDGETFLVKDFENNHFVIKILSLYGLKFLPLTKSFINARVKSDYIYHLKIIQNRFFIYPYEKLNQTSTIPKDFLDQLLMLSELEIELIKSNLVYTDFSNLDHINYLINVNNKLKIIDYGGVGFQYIDPPHNSIKFNRINLIIATNRYVQAKILLHIYIYGLGRKLYKNIGSLVQNSYLEVFKCLELCRKQIWGTFYSDISEPILKNNLLSIQGWKNVIKSIKKLKQKGKIIVMESSDIDNVIIENGSIKVTGYQNFIINNKKELIPLQGNTKLWATDVKYEFVTLALDMVKNLNINSFLDIGFNLGLYVFTAKLKYRIKNCIGIDYNMDYVKKAQKISDYLKLENCTFLVKKFEDLEESYDCVLAMGLIHHLYHRTESYGSLKPILEKFSKITNKVLILELPTEKDIKAKKWTSMPGRLKYEKYSLQNFLKHANFFFRKVIEVGTIEKTRKIFLLHK